MFTGTKSSFAFRLPIDMKVALTRKEHMEKITVGVIFGGRSAEHEISILSARNVIEALDRDRFKPILIGIDCEGRWLSQDGAQLALKADRPNSAGIDSTGALVGIDPSTPRVLSHKVGSEAPRTQRIDVVFPVLHGPMGEDGSVQGLLELADIPYVGAGVLGSALGMDKDVMKRLLRDASIPVGGFFVVRESDLKHRWAAVADRAGRLGYPLFTKPANMGSSVGVRRSENSDELQASIEHALHFDTKIVIEKAILGREFEVAVIGGENPIASVPGEIIVSSRDTFYSYNAKYVDENGARLVIPADIPTPVADRMRQLALKTFHTLECYGLARVDFFLEATGRVIVNELNTLPGFTAFSMFPKLWEVSGVSVTQVISTLIDLALKRAASRRQLVTSVAG